MRVGAGGKGEGWRTAGTPLPAQGCKHPHLHLPSLGNFSPSNDSNLLTAHLVPFLVPNPVHTQPSAGHCIPCRNPSSAANAHPGQSQLLSQALEVQAPDSHSLPAPLCNRRVSPPAPGTPPSSLCPHCSPARSDLPAHPALPNLRAHLRCRFIHKAFPSAPSTRTSILPGPFLPLVVVCVMVSFLHITISNQEA